MSAPPGKSGVDAITLTAVGAGGALGSVGRYAVSLAVPRSGDGFPWGTLIVNVSGCLAMGLLVAWLVMRPGAHRLARPFVGVGILGGWTTFSTMAVESLSLSSLGSSPSAVVYVVGTFALGIVAVWVGTTLGERVLERWS